MRITIASLFVFVSLSFANDKLVFEPNKMYVVDFFASWCSSCEKELPELSKIEPKLQSQGIQIIGVDVDKNKEDAKKFQKKMDKYLTFEVIDDSSNEIINTYKPLGMPALYVIKNQKVCGKFFGAVANLPQKLSEQIQNCKESR